MSRKQKLELTWIGKENRPKLEPRILLEDPERSYHASLRVSEGDHFDNRLIFGDNLLALKALEQEFAGKVKCVYIDPPFNTGQALEHYDDALEHSIWLSMMAERLRYLRRLLQPEGSLFVHLDQEEVHYLKVLLDEIFGRSNFMGQIAYERSGVSGIGQGGQFLVNTHEYILCYAKDKRLFNTYDNRGAAPLELRDMRRYSKILVGPGVRQEVARFIAPSTGEPVVIYKHSSEIIETISLRNIEARREEVLATYVENFQSVYRTTSVQAENEFQNRILGYCGRGLYSADYLVSRGRREGEQITAYYWNSQVFAWLADTAELRDGQIVRTNKLSDFWPHGDIPKANLANEGGINFRRGKKPEVLLQRILKLVSQPGDWILDSFAGSGTTGAVAHKMGRRWIMVELRDHCHSHVIPRLRSVIDGADQSGISNDVAWKGGGGFRYFRLAPSLLQKDRWGQMVINPQYNAAMLAEALCKLEGFTYAPSETVYWQHGRSTESDYIYVTTQQLGPDQLAQLSDEVGENRSLLVLCAAFRGDTDRFANLTVKKIPKQVLTRCEWGRDDYSLNVQNLPAAPAGPPAAAPERAPARQKKTQPSLFGAEDGE